MKDLFNRFEKKITSEKVYLENIEKIKNFNLKNFFESNFEYVLPYIENKSCSECTKIDCCRNYLPGHQIKLIYNDNSFSFCNFQCDKNTDAKKNLLKKNNFIINNFNNNLKYKNEFHVEDIFDNIKNKSKNKVVMNHIINLYNICIKTLKTGDPHFAYIKSKYPDCDCELLNSFCHEYQEKYPRKKIAYVKTLSLLNTIRQGFSKNSETSNNSSVINELSRCDLLILDDFGVEQFYYWFHIEIIYLILEHRVNNKKLVTYVLSRWSVDELKKHFLKDNNSEKNKKGIEVFFSCFNDKYQTNK